MEIEITYTPALIGVGPEIGDDVSASCEAFEVQVRREIGASYPDAHILVTRSEGDLADLVVTATNDRAKGLTVRHAVWDRVWDLIGPYARYARPHRGGAVRAFSPVTVAPAERGPSGFAMFLEDVYGDTIIDVDGDEVLAVMRSGFGVMA